MMKLKNLLLVVVAIPLLFSCKKEGDTIYEPADVIDSYRIKETVNYELGLVPISKTTYSYEGEKLIQKQYYSYNIGEWEEGGKINFTYDGDKIITESYTANDTTGLPIVTVETTIKNGNPIEINKYQYIDDVKTLTLKHVKNYDGDNLIEYLTFQSFQDYSNNTEVFDTSSVNNYFYANDTLVRREYRYRYQSNYDLEFTDSIIYSYENGKQIGTSYRSNNGEWELSNKTESIYSDNNLLNSYSYNWNETQNTWVESRTTTNTYSYSKDIMRVESESYDSWGDYSSTTYYEPGKGNANLFSDTWIYEY